MRDVLDGVERVGAAGGVGEVAPVLGLPSDGDARVALGARRLGGGGRAGGPGGGLLGAGREAGGERDEGEDGPRHTAGAAGAEASGAACSARASRLTGPAPKAAT